MLVWGGYVYTGYSDEVPQADGFVFDARSRTWSGMPKGPLAARVLPASAWTGTEFLIWGGAGDPTYDRFFEDGAAYDPRTGTWRLLPEAPVEARAPLSVWTGREFVVWGTAVRVNDPPGTGAAYDPAANSWRPIAEAPIELTGATAVWTGREMIVFGAALTGGIHPTPVAGAAYDPSTDTWRRLPGAHLSPQASTAAWNGREVIAWDYENRTAAYDPARGSWRTLADVPFDDVECSPQSVAVGRHVFGDYCGSMALYDPAANRWRDISRERFSGWGFVLVDADPAVLLIGRDVDTGEEGAFAYRPST